VWKVARHGRPAAPRRGRRGGVCTRSSSEAGANWPVGPAVSVDGKPPASSEAAVLRQFRVELVPRHLVAPDTAFVPRPRSESRRSSGRGKAGASAGPGGDRKVGVLLFQGSCPCRENELPDPRRSRSCRRGCPGVSTTLLTDLPPSHRGKRHGLAQCRPGRHRESPGNEAR
jgi:hypothetical protein